MFIRFFQRVLVFLVALVVIWFIAVQVFDRLDDQVHFFVALFLTYIIAAYLILPLVIHALSLVLRRGRIPRFTLAPDGLPADPVNIVLMGTKAQLRAAFTAAGWTEADRLTPRTAWRMARAFARNKPYPGAPFSSLILFARRQDVGFEEPIGTSPRMRHHVRFWSIDASQLPDPFDAAYWREKQDRPGEDVGCMWVGAATKDTGFGLSKLTFQLSHRVDVRVDDERDFLLNDLKQAGAIAESSLHPSGAFTVGKYVSDGCIEVATLST